jgi:hypothetical protein
MFSLHIYLLLPTWRVPQSKPVGRENHRNYNSTTKTRRVPQVRL